MATNESDFAKLLLDAPMARDADIVTVVGILERTHDTARFMLRMSDGRSVVLDVDAVKSAKTIAGAIGQSLVQLELDAKRTPESLLSNYKYREDPQPTWASSDVHYGTGAHDPIGGKNPAIEVGVDPTAGLAPFVARSHHVPDATIHALARFGNRTYFTAYDWTTDHHLVQKAYDQP
jgi:hypothetical protein